MECGAGERPGIAWRNFRTSISFGCSPHVWEGTPQGFVPRLSEWRFTYSLASRHVAFLCGTLPHVIAAQMFWRYLRSIPFFLRCEGMRPQLTSGWDLLHLLWACFFLSTCQIPHWEAYPGVWPLTIMLEVLLRRILIEELEDGKNKAWDWMRQTMKKWSNDRQWKHEADICGIKG